VATRGIDYAHAPMKVVLTLLVRDEEDIVDAQLAFHLNAGVDFVIATDNRSTDATAEILRAYARAGYLHLIEEPADDFRESEWVTRMARLAATEYSADWVINASADEFWWPRARSLKEALAAIPARYDAARGFVRNFPPRSDDGAPFFERMTARLSPSAPIVDPSSPFVPYGKVVFRAGSGVIVSRGGHELHSRAVVLRGWYPIEVLHYPIRTQAQLGRKAANLTGAFARSARGYGTAYHERAHAAEQGGQLDTYFDALAVDDDVLARGLAEGTLVIDTRIRDALRSLRAHPTATVSPGGFALPADGFSLVLPAPTVVDDAQFAVDAALLEEGDAMRLQRRLDQIERRVDELESKPIPRLERRLSRLAGRRRRDRR
jgi:hypothetical protein